MKDSEVLLVDDNLDDILFITMALNAVGCSSIHTLSNGKEALDLLMSFKDKSKRLFSNLKLIILDNKMPLCSGLEMLEELNGCWGREIPIVMFSSSAHSSDIDTANRHGVNSYVVKPNSVEKFSECVKQIYQYWTKTNFSIT